MEQQSKWIIKDVTGADRDEDAIVHKRIWQVVHTDEGGHTNYEHSIVLNERGELTISEYGGDNFIFLYPEQVDLLREILGVTAKRTAKKKAVTT